jgi:uncharacterized protein (TIGR02145 family)
MKNKIYFTQGILFICLLLLSVSSCRKDNDNSADTNILIDIDGNIYHSVRIGNQVWMKENLNVTHYRNRDKIAYFDPYSLSNSTGYYCNYNNDLTLGKAYGKLYNWWAVNDSRGLAPKGWHVASAEDWLTLTSFLSDTTNALGELTLIGYKLKEADTIHWKHTDETVTNEFGFSALPAGVRDTTGYFANLRYCAYWWSSTEKDLYNAWVWYIPESFWMNNYAWGKQNGFSVRCVKD